MLKIAAEPAPGLMILGDAAMSDRDADIKALSDLSMVLENGIKAYESRVQTAESTLESLRNCLSEKHGDPIDIDRLKDDGIRRTFIALLNGELY